MTAGVRLFSACVGNDIRLQIRHGLYTVYAVICLLYILILRSVPSGARDILLPVLVFMDPTMLGFFFVGGIVLLERSDRTLSGLFTTPIRITHYFGAKVVSLSLLAVLASEAIALLTVGTAYRPLLLAVSVIPTAWVFTLIGLGAVTRFGSVNGYLMGSVLYMLPFALPLVEYFGFLSTPLMYLLPSQGALVLITSAFRPEGPPPQLWIPSVASLGAWLAVGGWWASRWFQRYVILKVGEI